MIDGRPLSPLPPLVEPELDILYRDQHIIAINKPSGLLVHRSMIDRHETRFAIQLLRDQIGQRVYPLHRLDKPTSGVLVFALSPEVARHIGERWHNAVKKRYLAVVRGFTPEQICVDHPLKEKLDKLSDKKARTDKPAQLASTSFERLATIELHIAVERYPQSRYSLVACHPHTGRKHQIRRHLKHISHPIIGDAKHGKGVHNRYFSEHLSANRLLLHCSDMIIPAFDSDRLIHLQAQADTTMTSLFQRFDWLHAVEQLLRRPLI